jgi:hypothetical protein
MWIRVLAHLLGEDGWRVHAAPWRGDDAVIDLLASPAGMSYVWAIRIFDDQPPANAPEALRQDLAAAGADCGIVLGPLRSAYIGDPHAWSDDLARELGLAASRSRSISAML